MAKLLHVMFLDARSRSEAIHQM